MNGITSFRLSVIQVEIPPLRHRREDIVPLAEELLREIDEKSRFDESLYLAADAIEELERHSWPGNVRELKNVLERAASLADETLLKRQDIFLSGMGPGPPIDQQPIYNFDPNLD